MAEIFRALTNRLRDSTWTIVFKSLIIVHLMIREGEPEVTLKYLAQNAGRVFTRAQLLQEVWGYDFFGGTRTVDVHVRQIRRKLGDASPIVTVWGVGYKVASDRTTAPAA